MIREYKFIGLGLLGGIMIWPLDAWVDASFFTDKSFADELFHPSPVEIYFRTTVMAALLLFATFAYSVTRRLHQSETRLEQALQGANDGIWDWNLESREIYLSPRWKSMLGYQAQELPDRPESWIGCIAPEERGSCIKTLQQLAKGEIEGIEKEMRLRHKNGSWRTVLCRGQLIRNPRTGQPERLVGTHVDITERKANEEKLHHLSQAIEHAGEAIIITTCDGVIEHVNPAFTKITGYTLEEAVGQKPSILKSTAQDPRFYTELWETITDGRVWQGRLVDRRKDGSFFPTMMTVAPILDEKGRITHYVSTHQDMSELKQMEDRFFQAQKMESIGTLVGGIAHDFNNMLAVLMGSVYLAKQEPDNREALLKRLNSIERTGIRAADIVRQLLTFARKDRVEMRLIPFVSFIKESLKLLKSGIPENIQLTFDPGVETITVKGDATQLQQLLINLMVNARDAVVDRPNGKINCSLQRIVPSRNLLTAHPELPNAPLACLSVQDNGCGIPEPHQDKIFEPFFTTKDVDKGTGLGLAMVYGAVQRHSGAIEVTSTPGRGSTFNVYLPLTDEISLPETDETENIVEGHGELILLVDDEDSMRTTLAEVLESMHYHVLEAANGEEALRLFHAHKNKIRLLFTDIVMPQINGVELARAVREISPDMPVIFASGYGKIAYTTDDLVDDGVVLTKPFSAAKISQTLRRMLQK